MQAHASESSRANSKEKPVVVIGAGLSGLACAITLRERGVPCILIERKDTVGGRVATARHPSGYLFDRGFQVLLKSYPELPRFLDLERLELRAFHSGALVFNGRGLVRLANPLRHPQTALPGLFSGASTFADKLRVLGLVARARTFRDDGQRLGISTDQFLKDEGFSTDFIEVFWRPFLSGVFLDSSLRNDAGFFLFLLRCFGTGSVSVPAAGMAEIPRQMAARLEAGVLRLSTGAREISANNVLLETGEAIEASAVVCTFTDSDRADSEFRSVETHYFAVQTKLDWDRWLVLASAKLGFSVNHLALMSEVAPGYAPKGHQLLAASVVGPRFASVETVAHEVDKIAGRATGATHLETVRVSRALPMISSSTEGFRKERGVYICGDSVSSPSINGALRSGRLAGEAVAGDLGSAPYRSR